MASPDERTRLEPEALRFDHWEFFWAARAEGGVRGWGWRGRAGKEVVFESGRFDSFLSCYRNARAHGFTGDIDFAGEIDDPPISDVR